MLWSVEWGGEHSYTLRLLIAEYKIWKDKDVPVGARIPTDIPYVGTSTCPLSHYLTSIPLHPLQILTFF